MMSATLPTMSWATSAIRAMVGTIASGTAVPGTQPRHLGDVDGQVAHPLEVGDHPQRGDEHAQVPGHGLLEREQLEAPLLDPFALGVDLGVAGDDVLRHLRVALEQGLGRAPYGALDLVGHRHELVDDPVQLVVVHITHAPTVVRVSSWGCAMN